MAIRMGKSVNFGKAKVGRGFSFGCSMEGGDAWSKALESMGPTAIEAAEELAEKKADRIVERAKRLCPDDPETGGTDLRESIRRSEVKNKGGIVSVKLYAGGAILARLPSEQGKKSPGAYAIVVHEDMTMRHPNGGQAKFLEQPFLEEKGSLSAELSRAVKG